MGQYHLLFLQLQERLISLKEACIGLVPQKKDLKWFGKKRQEAQWKLLAKGTLDIQKHASTLIGYFDGYKARAEFQEQCISESGAHDANTCGALILLVIERVQVALEQCEMGRKNLSVNGPKLPGPERTLQLAIHHVQSLEEKFCLILLKVVSNDSLRIAIEKKLRN